MALDWLLHSGAGNYGTIIHDEEFDEVNVLSASLATEWKARRVPAAIRTPDNARSPLQHFEQDKVTTSEGTDILGREGEDVGLLRTSYPRRSDTLKASDSDRSTSILSQTLRSLSPGEEWDEGSSRSLENRRTPSLEFTGLVTQSRDQASSPAKQSNLPRSAGMQPACLRCFQKKIRCDRQQPCIACRKHPDASCVYNGKSKPARSRPPQQPRQTSSSGTLAVCVRCVEKKVRCDRQQPCSACKKQQDVQCVYNGISKLAIVEPPQQSSPPRSSGLLPPCVRCVEKKVRCDRQQPCSSCQKYSDVQCVYNSKSEPGSVRPKRAPVKRDHEASRTSTSSPVQNHPTKSYSLESSNHVQILIDMGFKPAAARSALRTTHGDLEEALDLLCETSGSDVTNTLDSNGKRSKGPPVHALVFPGMAHPYQLPETATTCLIDGCFRQGREPEKGKGGLRSRLHEHMKRNHGWPRSHGKHNIFKSSSSTVSRPAHEDSQSDLSSIPSHNAISSEIAKSGVGTKFVSGKAMRCSHCSATTSSIWHPARPVPQRRTTCHRCYMYTYRHGSLRPLKSATQRRSSIPNVARMKPGQVMQSKRPKSLPARQAKSCFICATRITSIWSLDSESRIHCESCRLLRRRGRLQPPQIWNIQDQLDDSVVDLQMRSNEPGEWSVDIDTRTAKRRKTQKSPVFSIYDWSASTETSLRSHGQLDISQGNWQAEEHQDEPQRLNRHLTDVSRRRSQRVIATSPSGLYLERRALSSRRKYASLDGATADQSEEERSATKIASDNSERISVTNISRRPLESRRQSIQLSRIAGALRQEGFAALSSIQHLDPNIAVRGRERDRTSLLNPLLTSHAYRRPDISSGLRRRELGDVFSNITREAFDTLGPHSYFKGTSADVNVVSWANDNSRFVVGSLALTDESSMQYNRPNNLLYGDVNRGTLQELGQHVTKRYAAKGVNARREMKATQEPFLFHTISAAQFTPDGRSMISTGYDCTAVVWDVTGETPKDSVAYPHSSPIDVLSVTSTGLFATGIKSVLTKQYPSVRVLRYDIDHNDTEREGIEQQAKLRKYHSQKGPNIVEPSCLRFGKPFGGQEKYLLAGFCSRGKDYGSGEINLWDVTRDDAPLLASPSTNVFDVAWSPTTYGMFAVGCSANHGKGVNRGTRSVVRLFDSLRTPQSELVMRKTRLCELECPALDINDLIFCEKDPSLISAGCTNGRIYTWDLRMSDRLLHTFEHAPTLSVHSHEERLEVVDTGVRFLSWGHGSRHLYSGSSDGVVTAWDPYKATEDAYIRDVVRLDSGVMSGAFSPDFTNLIIGDIHSSVSLLSVESDCNADLTMSSARPFKFHEAADAKKKFRMKHGDTVANESADDRPEAAMAAAELIKTGQVELRPFGNLPLRQAVQGPEYIPPTHDNQSDTASLRAAAEAFQHSLRLHEAEAPCVCTKDTMLFTEEDLGDSGVWKQRIPGATRFGDAPMADFLDCISHQSLQVRCLRCNEISLAKNITEASPPFEEDVLACTACGSRWLIEVLGYTPLSVDKGKNGVMSKTWQDIEVGAGDIGFVPEAEVEDLTEETKDHYLSMWGQTRAE